MSQPKFTPGEWRRSHLTIYVEIGGKRMDIAQVSEPHRLIKGSERDDDMEWCRGNARLMAASKDLFEALEIIIGDVDQSPRRLTRDEKVAIARKAIAKATGSKP